jgi:hypothetical protein
MNKKNIQNYIKHQDMLFLARQSHKTEIENELTEMLVDKWHKLTFEEQQYIETLPNPFSLNDPRIYLDRLPTTFDENDPNFIKMPE